MASRIRFLRGLESDLPSALVDGYVYVTTDTRAVYIDYANSDGTQRIRLGDVITVADLSTLQTNYPVASALDGALYYCSAENILCTPTGAGSSRAWKQINKQRDFADLIKTVTLSVDSYTAGTTTETQVGLTSFNLTSTITGNGTNETTGGSLKIITGGVLQARITDDGALQMGVPLIQSEFNISAKDNKINQTANMMMVSGDGQVQQKKDINCGSVTIAGSGAAVATTDNTITITAKPTLGLAFDESGNLTGTVTYNDNTSNTSDAITPSIVYGNGTTSTANFKNGAATLNVYTKEQVDTAIVNQLKTANAMTFKGTIGATESTVTALPTSNVALGDTYVVKVAGTYNSQICQIGDMFIAGPGAENADGYMDTITWTYVPAGNDDTAMVSGTVNTTDGAKIITSLANAETPVATIKADSGLTMSADSANKVLTVQHATKTVASSSGNNSVAQEVGTDSAFTALTAIEYDAYGHLTAVKSGTFTVKDTVVSDVGMKVESDSSKVATITTTITDSSATQLSDSLAIRTDTDSNIEFSVTTGSGKSNSTELNMNLVWGEF